MQHDNLWFRTYNSLRPIPHTSFSWNPVLINPPFLPFLLIPSSLVCIPSVTRGGKTSIQRVVFDKLSPHETVFLVSALAVRVSLSICFYFIVSILGG